MIHKFAQITWGEAMSNTLRAVKGDIGVELEIEGEYLPKEVTGWVVKAEGSLRGKNGRVINGPDESPDLPLEYVLERPSALSTLPLRLRVLENALKKKETTVNLTNRASTHIHLNMMNVRIKDIIGFMVGFTAIEPVLLRLCGPLRNGNLFCLPSYETGDLFGTAAQIANAVTQGDIRHGWPFRRGKYAALNLDPLGNLGSVEVRCFPNTIDSVQIARWATWLVNLRELMCAQDDTFLRFLDRVYRIPEEFLEQVFGNVMLNRSCQPHRPEELVRFGVEHAYEIAKAANVILDWSEKPKKKKDVSMYPARRDRPAPQHRFEQLEEFGIVRTNWGED